MVPFLSAMLVLLLFVPGLAEAKRVALVIGNAGYRDQPLANPVNDATDMAARLAALGVEVVQRTDANRTEMGRAIAEFLRRIGEGDEAMVFYAGHGVQVRGVNYLMPIDAEPHDENDIELQAISLDTLLRGLGAARPKVSLLLLDACRNNPFERRWRGSAGGLARVEAASGTLISYPAKPGTTAADGRGRNSPYTTAWLKELERPGIAVEDILKQVHVAVRDETGGVQETWQEGQIIGQLVLNPDAGGTAAAAASAAPPPQGFDARQIELKFWESAERDDAEAGYEAYLAQYPSGAFAGLARARLARRQPPPAAPAASAEALRAAPAPAVAAPPATAPAAAPVAAPAAATRPEPPAAGTRFRDCPACPDMVWLPTGAFAMGSPPAEAGREADEGPQHRVTMAQPLAVAVHEVTKGEFGRFVAATGRATGGSCWTYEDGEWEDRTGRSWRSPGYPQDDDHPVVCVSWDEAQAYTAWLGRETGQAYRLPSEAEWEYAARGGTTAARWWSGKAAAACRHANASDETRAEAEGLETADGTAFPCRDGHVHTAPVGRFGANGFALHDVLGNVWEWVADCWNESYDGAPDDGRAWTAGDCGSRAVRGGSWSDEPAYVRSAARYVSEAAERSSEIGFRLARTR